MQWTSACPEYKTFKVKFGSLLQRAGIGLYHRVQSRSLVVDFFNSGEVSLRNDQYGIWD